MINKNQKKVLIVGAGFGGIAAALVFKKHKLPDFKVTLVSDKPHFEYQPGLYRVVTGRSPMGACIPVREILSGKEVEFTVDTIVDVDLDAKIAYGSSGSRYSFDYLLLAVGSETSYFDIPGLKEFSYGFKSIQEALRLKDHLHKSFKACALVQDDKDEDLCRAHFIIVGAGASGVEIAGELASYGKELAREHGIDPALITIDLIEAAARILPMLPGKVSQKIEKRLRTLGVNVFTNRALIKEEVGGIQLKGMTMKSETIIWTAGVKPNSLYQKIKGLSFDKKGKAVVDEYLQPKGLKNIFIFGDGASTEFSGMAQTAIREGKLAADNILRSARGARARSYVPRKPYHSLPVGSGWAATIAGPMTFYGRLGWFLRKAADLRFFFSILPWSKAWGVFGGAKTLCGACEICLPEGKRDGVS